MLQASCETRITAARILKAVTWETEPLVGAATGNAPAMRTDGRKSPEVSYFCRHQIGGYQPYEKFEVSLDAIINELQ